MSDDRVATMIDLADGASVSFQEYFVKLRHSVPVAVGRFDGAADATLSAAAAGAVADADVIVIAPSNPIVSIGPLRALAGIDDLLTGAPRQRRRRVADRRRRALKGPADRMLTELGHEATVVGVARLYATIAGDARHRSGRRGPRRRSRSGGHASRRDALGHELAGRRCRARAADPCRRRRVMTGSVALRVDE